jgi:hypothetical protein
VGNFETQKQLKAGGDLLSSLYYAKTAFGCGFRYSQPLWLCCWLLAKAKAGKSPTKDTLCSLLNKWPK